LKISSGSNGSSSDDSLSVASFVEFSGYLTGVLTSSIGFCLACYFSHYFSFINQIFSAPVKGTEGAYSSYHGCLTT